MTKGLSVTISEAIRDAHVEGRLDGDVDQLIQAGYVAGQALLECGALGVAAQVGDFVAPDEWGKNHGGFLKHGDPPVDASFPGCQFRLDGAHGSYAVNVEITGKRRNHAGNWGWRRCRIEFVGDGEPSVFSGGWIKTSDDR